MSDEDTALQPLGVVGLSDITVMLCQRCGSVLDAAWGQAHLTWHRQNDVSLQPTVAPKG